MTFLRVLEALRTPFWDKVFALVTHLGDEAIFAVIVLIVSWCINKKWGYRLLIACLVSGILNQILKAIFIVPRPWVKDGSFTIVEAARAGATGYSFPSGHTQTAAVMFGGLAIWIKKRRATVTAAALVVITAFSRMYLGVHTPTDVLGALAAAAVVLVTLGIYSRNDEGDSMRKTLEASAFGVALALVLLMIVTLLPKRPANVPEFDAHALDSTWKLLGMVTGFTFAICFEDKCVRYDVHAIWWAQCIKVIGGLAVVLATRAVLKPLMAAIMGADSYAAGGIRYLLMTFIGAGVWPMTFRFWTNLGRHEQRNEQASQA